MTTWNSRIVLRHDGDFVIDDVANIYATLGKGEVAFAIDSNGRISGRVGVQAGGMPFDECPEVFTGGDGIIPLSVEVPSGSGLADGSILRWDPATSRFVADAEAITVPTATTGSLSYTSASDEWSIDTASFIPALLDGGAFVGSSPETPVAPSFTTEPTFGEPEPA